MAMIGIQYTVTATANNPLVLSSANPNTTGHQLAREMIITADSNNMGAVYVGSSTVTAAPANAYAQIVKGTNWKTGPFDRGSFYIDEVYIVGTASDKAYIQYTI